MTINQDRIRPLAYEEDRFLWNLRRVPRTLPDGKTSHPGRTSAIFVVHGIGDQVWTGTAAGLRSGFEDAFENIRKWQEDKKEEEKKKGKKAVAQAGKTVQGIDIKQLPPPFVYEGYWADYPDLKSTFPEDWLGFNTRERSFFSKLWEQRVLSVLVTACWYLRQLWNLVRPRSLLKNPFLWVLYLPLLIFFPLTMLVGMVRYPKLISGYLEDVRLYVDPRGDVERAIVQRIDRRVGAQFLQLLGLDWDFRTLAPSERIEAGGERLTFNRIVWVAHSLGTVISYNVLSSLFRRADEIDHLCNDKERQINVELFRRSLARFVTLGSPLDKIAYLFHRKALTPWQEPPSGNATAKHRMAARMLEWIARLFGMVKLDQQANNRLALLDGGESDDPKAGPEKKEWWVNFYSAFDPVSGPLDNKQICGEQPPWNYPVFSLKSFFPGYSHVSYWSDKRVLKYILGRAYGCDYLHHGEYMKPWYSILSRFIPLAGYLTWGALLFGAVYVIYYYRIQIWEMVINLIKKAMGS